MRPSRTGLGRRAARLLLPLALVVLLPLPALAATGAPARSAVPADRQSSDAQDGVALMRVVVPDQAGIDRLQRMGVDLAEYTRPVDGGGIEVHAVLSPQESKSLRAKGFDVGAPVADQRDVAAVRKERTQTLRALAADAATTDALTPLRADWFTSVPGAQRYLSVEAKTSDPAATNILTVAWDKGRGTDIGSGGSATMDRFTDAGQYMYHRFDAPLPVGTVPDKARITSTSGGSITVEVERWLGEPRKPPGKHYVSDFVDHYMDPTEIDQRFEGLAAEFPTRAELIELPYKTNGYRRAAQAQFGAGGDAGAASTFYVSSNAYGSEGGNDVSLALVDPGAADHPLTVSVDGTGISVELATDAAGAVSATAADVVAALNADPGAAALVTASTYRGDAGAGIVSAAPPTRLTDDLRAPAAVSRDPFQMKALRIGKERDGSQPGAFLYCQEHAREWVTPLVCVEAAERLLRNYAHDRVTRKLVDNLDIFVVASMNPDGAHYSFYDFNLQRKNMTNHCGPADADPARRTSWGVDLNRNFTVGSHDDGYSGGSDSCRSGNFSGPTELSEPEARNEVWLTQEFPNIRFGMNTHSYGGYFMWPPGAYQEEGRTPLPYVDLGTDTYFWESSEHILSAVQRWRGTAIWPGRTGPVTDVLYSAAGNSADEHWYNRGIIGWDFEVGADIYDPATGEYEAVGFQPPFSEGHEEAMEFASGQIATLEVALAYARDDDTPRSRLTVTDRRSGATDFTFDVDEPAKIYYTLDGTRPTLSSPLLEMSAPREGPETLTLTSTTRVKWFSVDMAGNVENHYRPDRNDNRYRQELVRVRP
jgi:Zinc carboxypeptidase/Chitobiase/beta-hexosaminidase C-terminal domain